MLRLGGRVVWVENARTQELVPILLTHAFADAESDEMDDTVVGRGTADTDSHHIPLPAPLDTKGDIGADPQLANLTEFNDLAGDNPRSSEFRDLASSMQMFYIFCQGLFAGFCFSTLYAVLGSRNSDGDFLTSYWLSASEHRRLSYLLAVISVVGSFDALLQIVSARNLDMQTLKLTAADSQQAAASFRPQVSSTSQFLSELLIGVAGTLTHSAAFITTLVMSITDVRIATRNDYQVHRHTLPAHESWVAFALQDGSFR